MRFYAIEDRLAEAIAACETPLQVRVKIDFTGEGDYFPIVDSDIIELNVTSLREKIGGTITFGTLILNNTSGAYNPRTFGEYLPYSGLYNGLEQEDGQGNLRSGRQLHVLYTTGNGIPFVKRFSLFVDDRGFQQTATGSKERTCTIGLVDLARKLKDTDKAHDWTETATIVRSIICDKSAPATSVVHQIAARAGLGVNDIDCSTITEYLPFVRLTRSVWAELSDLATIYEAHLETAVEKPLIFVNSTDPVQYTLDKTNLTHIRMYDLADQYRNTIRGKWTRYVEMEDVEIWRYQDDPAVYDENLTPSYPFIAGGEKRAIEEDGYEAHFVVKATGGRTLPVAWADNVSDGEAFSANLVTDGPALEVLAYDATSYRDRSMLKLGCTESTILRSAVIRGDAITAETNFCEYVSDADAIARDGTVAENITTPYFSETLRDGVPYYRIWIARRLVRLLRRRKGFFCKTNRALFHARVGAAVRVELADGLKSERAEIVRMELRYKKNEAFVTSFYLEEG